MEGPWTVVPQPGNEVFVSSAHSVNYDPCPKLSFLTGLGSGRGVGNTVLFGSLSRCGL